MRLHHRDRGAIVAGLLFTMVGVGFLLDSLEIWRADLVYLWPMMLIALGVTVLLGRAERLEAEENRAAQLAVAEERVRIARELHDVVAHGVSLMTVQIGAARKVAQSRPEESAKALEAAEKAGRESLNELREIVSILRSADASIEAARPRKPNGEEEEEDRWAPLPSLDSIESLVEGTRSAGRRVNLETTGTPGNVSPATQLAAYRVIQEALTNTVRHAGENAEVNVKINYAPRAIEISVEDDGVGTLGRSFQENHGIVGMRERVTAAGGWLQVGPREPTGWRVAATLPVKKTGS